jgi:hypothetical protein
VLEPLAEAIRRLGVARGEGRHLVGHLDHVNLTPAASIFVN